MQEARWNDRDQAIVDQVEPSLQIGRELKDWWDRVHYEQSYAQRFPLVRTFNRPDESFGFFDVASTSQGELAVMGDFQSMFYDQPKGTSVSTWRDELREFVLRYFLRISDFRPPRTYADQGRRAPRWLAAVSWCPDEGIEREGFGYAQLYYKRRDNGSTGKFAGAQHFAITDLREIGETYDWIVCRIRIFDFDLRFRPFGIEAPEFTVPLKEDTYVVLCPDLISNVENPEPGVLGQYGVGYTVFPDPLATGPLAYGPGQFATGFQLVYFRVLESGETQARLVFVVNRPERLLRMALNPLVWPFRLAELATLGLSSRLLAPAQRLAESPILNGLSLLNSLTGRLPERQFCVSREQLETTMLVQHFMQHYEMVIGSLLTWRQIPDWLDERAIPEWVHSGVTS